MFKAKSVLRQAFLAITFVIAGLASVPFLANAHDWIPDDGCAPGISNDGYSWAAGPSSYWVVDTGSGANGCHLRTLNTTSSRTNWNEWYLPINSSNYNHTYSIGPSVYSYSTDLTLGAHYKVWGSGHEGSVTANYYLNQNSNRWGYCYYLGSTSIYGYQSGGLVELEDVTGETAGTKWVAVDQFCYYD